MMIEYGFNEILLVKFITKYFAFDTDQNSMTRGYALISQIIDQLVTQDRKI